jgi:hypothetical protein
MEEAAREMDNLLWRRMEKASNLSIAKNRRGKRI